MGGIAPMGPANGRLRDSEPDFFRDLADLPARLTMARETLAHGRSLCGIDGEQEPARGLRLVEQVHLGFGERRVDGELAARAEGALHVAAVGLHAAAPVALLRQREGAR